jgi:hypothetical protein
MVTTSTEAVSVPLPEQVTCAEISTPKFEALTEDGESDRPHVSDELP